MFAIKAPISQPDADTHVFSDQKTMYGGKTIAAGDLIYLFASENEGGLGLVACGRVTAVTTTPSQAGLARQTPRVSIHVQRSALAQRHLGRADLRPWSNWADGRPETELNFKFYRQATNKIVGISDHAAAFLQRHF